MPELTRLESLFPPSTRLAGGGAGFTATRPPRDWSGLIQAIGPHPIARIHHEPPRLEDVFFALTGRHLREEDA